MIKKIFLIDFHVKTRGQNFLIFEKNKYFLIYPQCVGSGYEASFGIEQLRASRFPNAHPDLSVFISAAFVKVKQHLSEN